MAYTLDHIHLVCRNLQEMIDFFTQNLEAELVTMKKFAGVDGATLDLSGTTINLRVSQKNENLADPGSCKIYGYHHVGIAVDNIEAEYKKLSDKGFKFSLPPKDLDDTLTIAFFEGPESLTIELLQRK
jgi:catechol 2,3-dioxygenase-like lactoylglutathione lyase family enzyme